MSDRTPLLADHVVSINGPGALSRDGAAVKSKKRVVSKPEGDGGRFNRLDSIALPAFDPQEKNASPFVSTTPVGRYEATKMLVFCCLLIPVIKVILITFVIFMCYVHSKIAMLGRSKRQIMEEPMGPFRRFLMLPVRFWMRMWYMPFGYYYIPVFYRGNKGSLVDPRRVFGIGARVIVCNHLGLTYAVKILIDTGASVAVKHTLLDLPMVGVVLQALMVIPIDRRTSESRKRSKELLEKRIRDPRFPPVLIFPQGTTTNQWVLTQFSVGAFSSGVPVQPVCLRFPHCHWDGTQLSHRASYVIGSMCVYYVVTF
jgi:lysophosphatidylcholine acyltransferase/lyso-PAF acetyltransferase